jgi:RNA polymerase sigma factor (sigma-70 family)
MEFPPGTGPIIEQLTAEARAIAWRHYQQAPPVLELDELVSIAYEGLLAAAKRWPDYCAERHFDPGAVQYFKTYATRRMNGAILDHMRGADHLSRLQRGRARQLREASQARTSAERAQAAGLTRQQVWDTEAALARKPVAFDPAEHDMAGPADVDSSVFAATVLAAGVAAIRRMDTFAQLVIALHYYGGASFGQISAVTGEPEERVSAAHTGAVLELHAVMLAAALG